MSLTEYEEHQATQTDAKSTKKPARSPKRGLRMKTTNLGPCPNCDGKGWYWIRCVNPSHPNGCEEHEEACEKCKGSGEW